MRIVFFGTSSFAARVLARLIEQDDQVVAVVTRPDRMKGRHLQPSPPPVKETVLKLQVPLPVFQPEKASHPDFASVLQTFHADLFVVVAYGEIIKKNLLDMPKLGCINIHASLLPKFRGAAPIQHALIAGEKETGITIIEMEEQMDAGPILASAAIPIPEQMTFGELEPKLCELSCKLLFEVIQQYQRGVVKKNPQNHALATFAPKLTAESEQIDWNKPAQALHNQVRALSPFPGASCQILIGNDRKKLKIKKTEVVDKSAPAGTVLCCGKEGFIVACGAQALRLLEVQLEGKKTMSADEFIRGLRQPPSLVK